MCPDTDVTFIDGKVQKTNVCCLEKHWSLPRKNKTNNAWRLDISKSLLSWFPYVSDLWKCTCVLLNDAKVLYLTAPVAKPLPFAAPLRVFVKLNIAITSLTTQQSTKNWCRRINDEDNRAKDERGGGWRQAWKEEDREPWEEDMTGDKNGEEYVAGNKDTAIN